MARSVPFLNLYILFFSLSTTMMAGCYTLAGFVVGSEVDPGHPGASLSIADSLKTLLPGTRVFVLKKDSSFLSCVFGGVVRIPDTVSESRYRREFEQWRLQRDKDSGWNPPFGTSIQVRVNVPAGRSLYAGRFAGFDRGLLRISCPPSDEVLPLKPEFIIDIRDSLGKAIATPEAVYQALKDSPPLPGRVEYTSNIILDGGSEGMVAFDSVLGIFLPESGSGKWIGLGIGVFMDIAVVAMVIADPPRIGW